MRWALEIPGSSDALAEIEGDPRLVRVAKRSKTLSNKPVVEIAHQVWTNDRGVASYESFVVVDTRDVDVLRLVGRRCENESLIVIAIAGHIAIRHRQSLEVCHGGWVGSCLCWIDLLQLRKTEGDVSRRGSVHLTTLALHSESGPAWTLSRVETAVRIESAQILKDAIAHRQTGNLLPGTYGFLRPPRPLVIQ